MAATFKHVPESNCDCGEVSDQVYVDFADCGGHGVVLKQSGARGGEWISLTDKQVERLVDALIEYQNR